MYEYEDDNMTRDEIEDLRAIGEGQWARDGVVWDDPDMLVDVDD